ncbi:hypothetical protein MCY_01570 [Bartonella rattimassiliensis 15908]|uniref:Uncharacterized protein n=1 Tax=Bartonella rattimassiliensis 15908 TaxID=1094556 RepID=J0QJF2_9HYPH|nr:hypothetical protein MCY_01570 [Bartonella rattimassiliensis 15908]
MRKFYGIRDAYSTYKTMNYYYKLKRYRITERCNIREVFYYSMSPKADSFIYEELFLDKGVYV